MNFTLRRVQGRTIAGALLMLMAFVPLVPTSVAAASGCSLPVTAPDVLASVAVLAPFPNGLGGACGPPAGTVFTSTAAACPLPPFVGALPGEFCGPLVDPGAAITCTAATATAHTDQLVVGLDFFPYDGNVGFFPFDGKVVLGEPLTHDATPSHGGPNSASITNPSLLPARVIAYPICPEFAGFVLVGCS